MPSSATAMASEPAAVQLSFTLVLVLGASVVLNAAFLIAWLNNSQRHPYRDELSWTVPASTQAELAESYRCSGHGHVYAETLQLVGRQGVVCDCDECFTGASCEIAIPDCHANVDSGDPIMFEAFWKRNPESSALLIPGWYRLGYEFLEPVLPVLKEEILALHALVGNAVTEGKYIVVGNGATQLMMAAFSSISSNAKTPVVVKAPYYDPYKKQVIIGQPGNVIWAESSFLEEDEDLVPIEIVTSPNNPDGSLRTRVLSRANSYVVYDHAYYWPHYTAIEEPLDNDIMFFTLSKVTGHAGTRVGWALLKDLSLYEKMLLAIRLNSVGVSRDAQFRAARLLQSVQRAYSQGTDWSLKKSTREYAEKHLLFHYGHTLLRKRWDRMAQVLGGSQRFLVQQDFEPKYCNFFKETVPPAPAFAWIRCVNDDDDCRSLFERAGILGRGGAKCGMSDQYVRLAMMSADSVFENLINRTKALVANE